MRNIVLVERVAIDENGILSVKPKREIFDMIYRAAMGVRWDSDSNYLYFNSPTGQKNDIVEFYNFILRAVSEEYGKTLQPDSKTIYENIDEETIAKIKKL